ncbi:hypothetical protein FE236_07205 [Mariprofundus erugo]|uniref:hypothetical protein n=1 Tax=Mariprofundus erugo TaxID=2528639 RepID=UPI0010FEACE0|nr:hypothetical protein [Mariprofundus erugo]TLS76408.1 hypothetical protein FE236_07205 [Mariprofundus erugo]
MKLAVYISGHGFGHLAQVAPVLNELQRRYSNCTVLIRCALAEEEIRARLTFDFQLDRESVDVGVVQKSAIEEDREASIDQLRHWLADMDARVQREKRLLAEFSPDLILSNISPLAFPVARALAVPSIGLATLDWHTIYSSWLEPDDPALAVLAKAYACCDLLCTPPMAMVMPVFPEQRKVPLIAAKPQPVSYALPVAASKTALVIFGGSAQPPFDYQALARCSGWHFLMPEAPADAPANVSAIRFDASLRAVDVMPYVDAVVCKPGYGILSECWSTSTPIVWVERPDFPEFPMLKGWLESHFPAAGMSRSEFSAGEWLHALEKSRQSPRSYPDPAGDGAQTVAELISRVLLRD